jgi:hypothetical protein
LPSSSQAARAASPVAKTPWNARHAQVAIDYQPAGIVALGGDLFGQRGGANARRPNDGFGHDVFAAGQA